MAKLYATITSDKDRKKVSKGGHDSITFTLYEGNDFVLKVIYHRELHELELIDDTENLVLRIDGPTQIDHLI